MPMKEVIILVIMLFLNDWSEHILPCYGRMQRFTASAAFISIQCVCVWWRKGGGEGGDKGGGGFPSKRLGPQLERAIQILRQVERRMRKGLPFFAETHSQIETGFYLAKSSTSQRRRSEAPQSQGKPALHATAAMKALSPTCELISDSGSVKGGKAEEVLLHKVTGALAHGV